MDVDGQFGAFVSRAYARISVANAMGHAERLERWLRPPNLVVGIQPVAPVVNNVGGAAVVDDEEGEVVELEMGVVGVDGVAAGLIDFDVEMIQGGELYRRPSINRSPVPSAHRANMLSGEQDLLVVRSFDEKNIEQLVSTPARGSMWNANYFFDDTDPRSFTEELSETEYLGGQLQSISIHDQVVDLAEKLNSLPELPEEWIVPSRALIERFLDLQRPRLDSKMLECCKMDGN